MVTLDHTCLCVMPCTPRHGCMGTYVVAHGLYTAAHACTHCVWMRLYVAVHTSMGLSMAVRDAAHASTRVHTRAHATGAGLNQKL